MKSPSPVSLAATLVVVVLVQDVFGATIICPRCDKYDKNDTSLIVCAQENHDNPEEKFFGNFRNYCEMQQFNCLNNRRYFSAYQGKRCENINEKAWGRQLVKSEKE